MNKRRPRYRKDNNSYFQSRWRIGSVHSFTWHIATHTFGRETSGIGYFNWGMEIIISSTWLVWDPEILYNSLPIKPSFWSRHAGAWPARYGDGLVVFLHGKDVWISFGPPCAPHDPDGAGLMGAGRENLFAQKSVAMANLHFYDCVQHGAWVLFTLNQQYYHLKNGLKMHSPGTWERICGNNHQKDGLMLSLNPAYRSNGVKVKMSLEEVTVSHDRIISFEAIVHKHAFL